MMNPSAGDTVNPTKTSLTTGETPDGGNRRPPARTESNPVARKRQLEPLSTKTEIPTKTPRHGEHPQDNARSNKQVARMSQVGNGNPMRIRGGSSLATTLVPSSHVEKPTIDSPMRAPSAPMEPPLDDDRLNIPKSSEPQTSDDPGVSSLSKDNDKTRGLECPTSSDSQETSTRIKIKEQNVQDNDTPKSLKRPPEDLGSNAKIQRKEDPVVQVSIKIIESQETSRTVPKVTSIPVTTRDPQIDQEVSKDESDIELRQVPQDELRSEEVRVTKKPPIYPEGPQKRAARTVRRDDAARLRKTIQWLEEGARRMREDLAATRAELHEERKAARMARRELDTAVREARNMEAAKHQQIISELKIRLSQSPSRLPSDATSSSTKAELLKEENHRRELSATKKRLAEAESTIQKLKSNSLNPKESGKRRKLVDGRPLEVEVQNLRAANKRLEEKLSMLVEAERSRTVELRVQHENHEAELAALQKTLRSDTIKMMDEIRSKNREIEKLEKLVQEGSQMHRKLQTKEDDLMRKLRESERNHQIRLAPRIDEKIPGGDHAVDLCKGDCEAVAEVERLRELAVEQQEVIEVLRQAVKEKERKLDQLSNKKRKEEFYRQWLELEPVAEVDDEEEHEEGDSALSSAPSSLSPQPGGCGQWQANGVTREAYEAIILEVDELQTKLLEEQQELAHAKSQVRDLEKALLQETRGSQNSRQALSDKLREAEEREAALVSEISELRDQNELLEFRVLELEEAPCTRDTPDPADSGIVSPEPIHIYKDQSNKQRDRAVATVIPYNTYTHPVSPVPQKTPLSLQESGIFDEEDETEVELASRGTQTEAPAGELLQEVQRLHELRARIQERAVKVPVPIIDAKTNCNPEVVGTVDTAQVTSYQERIRELEERLCSYEEEEEKQLLDKQVSKQREEELLDENYRLTERVYWVENELRNVKDKEKSVREVGTITDIQIFSMGDSSSLAMTEKLPLGENTPGKNSNVVKDTVDVSSVSHCGKIFHHAMEKLAGDTALEMKDYGTSDDSKKFLDLGQLGCAKDECIECRNLWIVCSNKIQRLTEEERQMREQISDLERREEVFVKTLQQADSMWLQLESEYATQLKELRDQLSKKFDVNQRLTSRLCDLEEEVRRTTSRQNPFQGMWNFVKSSTKDEVDCSMMVESCCAEPMEIDVDETPSSRNSFKQNGHKNFIDKEPENVEEPVPATSAGRVTADGEAAAGNNRGESATVSSSKAEVTRFTQTDEFTVTLGDWRHSAKSNQHDKPRSTQPVPDGIVKTEPPLVSQVESVSRHDATASVAHSRITVDVPSVQEMDLQQPELAKEAREEDFAAGSTENSVEADREVSQALAEEEHADEEEAVVTFTEREPEKKIIYFRWR
ncbi:janus kinase and microtubule-interacting protein 3 isoform X2 [Cephus cinctus]|uniref:Janus kinase and microtubule-interacting protein 3 isoform X2 n=1 Tax=Cephus cinctus TaxID=211228 RepID=A0AAJ7BY01_CEPCN|nr:janus kinase and microtubule-interacting protein 3 isoform X2 [Cephus cinctus]